ncbi:MAG: hypothetical protein FLDDKLPJ_03477 [Phycisphaerae bacterium]|nr:hypothetical protein [Phycisphaerae bacterium]
MPVFEYVCRGCGCEFEELVNASDNADRVRCPDCAGATVNRKISVFAAAASTMGSNSGVHSPSGCGRCGDPTGPCGAR